MKGFARPFFSNFAISEASPSTRAVLSRARASHGDGANDGGLRALAWATAPARDSRT